MMRMKQDTLATKLGDDWNQKKVSLLEQKETIEPELLEQVAMALSMPAEAIKNFTEETAVNIITNNTFENTENSQAIAQSNNGHHEINQNIDEKMIEILQQILANEQERSEMIKDLIAKLAK